MKKALILASVASMIDQFNMQNIKLLLSEGYSVDVAANFENPGSITIERANELKQKLSSMGVRVFHTPIPRSIFHINRIYQSYKQVSKLCATEHYDLLHCHSPIGGVVARLAAAPYRKHGTRVIYTAHGFHFYKGAPLLNWMLFYPIEKFCSYLTDVIITINKEDYHTGCNRLSAKETVYIPGIGIDTSLYCTTTEEEKNEIRKQLGIPSDSFVLLSVGELNKNKNHEIILRALACATLNDIHYYIIGKGALHDYLQKLASQLGIQSRVHLIGFRSDVQRFYQAADAFAFPSYREGLSVSLMEAMASGLPCIASKIRGNVDLVDEGNGGYLCQPDDLNLFRSALNESVTNKDKLQSFGQYNRCKVASIFAVEHIMDKLHKVYFAI